MVFGSGKGDHWYNKAKNGAKSSSDGADAPSELLLGVLALVKQS